MQSAYGWGKVVSPTHWPLLPPREHSWYSFLLKADSSLGPKCTQKDYVNEKFQWNHRESNLLFFRLAAQCLNQLRNRVPFMRAVSLSKNYVILTLVCL